MTDLRIQIHVSERCIEKGRAVVPDSGASSLTQVKIRIKLLYYYTPENQPFFFSQISEINHLPGRRTLCLCSGRADVFSSLLS